MNLATALVLATGSEFTFVALSHHAFCKQGSKKQDEYCMAEGQTKI